MFCIPTIPTSLAVNATFLLLFTLGLGVAFQIMLENHIARTSNINIMRIRKQVASEIFSQWWYAFKTTTMLQITSLPEFLSENPISTAALFAIGIVGSYYFAIPIANDLIKIGF